MAEETSHQHSTSRRFVINLNSMPRLPANINLNTAEGRQSLGQVVQGILPALNQVYQSSSNAAAATHLPPTLRVAPSDGNPGNQIPEVFPVGNHSHVRLHQGQGENSGSGSGEAFVVDMQDIQQDAPTLVLGPPDENQNQGHGGHGPANRAQNGEGQGGRQTVNLGALPLKMLEQNLPYAILMFAKIMYNHRLGILVFLGLCGTFHHANSSLKRQVSRRDRQQWTESAGSFLWIICFMLGNIFFIYYVFEEEQLWRCLIFQVPHVPRFDLMTLLWVTAVTDFVIKFGTIVLKAMVGLLPGFLIPYKRRGKYYMFLENVSQFYRFIVPFIPWFCFLQDDEYGGPWFAWVLIVAYVVLKAIQVWQRARELRVVFKKFQMDVSYGTCPTREDLKEADTCPICQDSFTDPVKLSCQHIFCEDCVSMWFDRERTCPMCRASIADNPVWRDGSTANHLQFY